MGYSCFLSNSVYAHQPKLITNGNKLVFDCYVKIYRNEEVYTVVLYLIDEFIEHKAVGSKVSN